MKVNFSSQFQSIVDKWGDLEAIVNVERDRRFTYREFHLVTNIYQILLKELNAIIKN